MLMDLNDIKSARILVIDDEEINLEIVEELLEDNGFMNGCFFTDPAEAIECYQNNPPDIVLLDLNMPVLTGFDVMQKFDEIELALAPPVLVLTALADKQTRLKALKVGARDFLSKPFDDEEVLSRMGNLLEMHLAHKANLNYSHTLEEKVQQRTRDLLDAQNEMLERLGLAAEYRDNETAAHTIRVGHYSKAIALAYGLSEKDANELKLAAPMHDLGKIGVPDGVLLKSGKLDADEWKVMKKHADIGYRILKDSQSPILKNAAIIALTHHEKWNGSGYPNGLKGESIHLYGRITAVSDVFDALTMERPYKKAWSIDAAVKLINEESAQHFDPLVVQAFNQVIDVLVEIRDKYAD